MDDVDRLKTYAAMTETEMDVPDGHKVMEEYLVDLKAGTVAAKHLAQLIQGGLLGAYGYIPAKRTLLSDFK